MKKIDVFNLNNVKDIPDEILEKLGITAEIKMRYLIYDMFKLANRQLSIQEAVVGFYRLYTAKGLAKEIRLSLMQDYLLNYSRCSNPILKKCGRGKYVLRDDLK